MFDESVMNVQKWQKIKNAFNEAAMLEEDERELFWDSIGDEEIRREAKKLLAADAESATLAPLFQAKKQNEIPHSIGNYRIESELGRGGMGVVYLATRVDLKKRVALKVVRRGMDSDEIVRRFLTEREILAALEHHNIARLLDGGTTDDGLPFFVMEYVDGEDLLTYCEKNHLSADERIELFRKICQAISYAHSRLIVHRDLKPSNILVMSDGEPKLLDFGISKLLTADSIGETGTATKLGMMTPKYASPEQFRGETVSTATDIYSLGVILFELLTGVPPFDFENRRLDEIARIVFESEPPRPSSAVSSTSNGESPEMRKHYLWQQTTGSADSKFKTQNLKFLRGDLDNIILKALRKEVERRYVSVENLSEDLRRYLQGLPVTAHADTFSYRAEKFFNRNRAFVLSSLLILFTLLSGITVAAWQAKIAREAQIKAEKETEKARKIGAYTGKILSYANPLWYGEGSRSGGEAKVIDVVVELADNIDAEFSNQPDVQAELHHKFADIFLSLKFFQSANSSNLPIEPYEKFIFHARRALELRKQVHGERHEEVAKDLYLSCSIYFSDAPKRRECFSQAIEIMRETNPKNANFPYLLEDYAGSLSANGNFAAAETHFTESLQSFREKYGENDHNTARLLVKLADIFYQRQDFDKAETHKAQARRILENLKDSGGAENTRQNFATLLGDK